MISCYFYTKRSRQEVKEFFIIIHRLLGSNVKQLVERTTCEGK
jgi:hypothetical protein